MGGKVLTIFLYWGGKYIIDMTKLPKITTTPKKCLEKFYLMENFPDEMGVSLRAGEQIFYGWDTMSDGYGIISRTKLLSKSWLYFNYLL